MHTAREKGFTLLILLVLGILLFGGLGVWFFKDQRSMNDSNVLQENTTPTPVQTQTPQAMVDTKPAADHPQLESKPQKPTLRSLAQ